MLTLKRKKKIFKNKEKKEVTPTVRFEPAIPGFWGYGTPVQ